MYVCMYACMYFYCNYGIIKYDSTLIVGIDTKKHGVSLLHASQYTLPEKLTEMHW